MRMKCLPVRSVTYAQKAEGILKRYGIRSNIIRQEQGMRIGCGWCIAVPLTQSGTARSVLENGGVRIAGEPYDLL